MNRYRHVPAANRTAPAIPNKSNARRNFLVIVNKQNRSTKEAVNFPRQRRYPRKQQERVFCHELYRQARLPMDFYGRDQRVCFQGELRKYGITGFREMPLASMKTIVRPSRWDFFNARPFLFLPLGDPSLVAFWRGKPLVF